MSNVPRNLRYDQAVTSSLAEDVLTNFVPEGRLDGFGPTHKMNFRFTTAGGYVDSFASSTLNFDLTVTNTSTTADTAEAFAFDAILGAHQLIDRIEVTVGGNVIEDTREYAHCYKMQKMQHSQMERQHIDKMLTEDQDFVDVMNRRPFVLSELSYNWENRAADAADAWVGTPAALFSAGTDTNTYDKTKVSAALEAIKENFREMAKIYNTPSPDDGALQSHIYIVPHGSSKTLRCQINLMSVLGSLMGAKYFPSLLLQTDVRLEITFATKFKGMVLSSDSLKWGIDNVSFWLTRVRLDESIQRALISSANSGQVQVIMPKFDTNMQTVELLTSGSVKSEVLKPVSNAASLKAIYVTFTPTSWQDVPQYNYYDFVDPGGLEYQFRLGTRLKPQYKISSSVDKFRECMRCVGGPINNTEHKLLFRYRNWRKIISIRDEENICVATPQHATTLGIRIPNGLGVNSDLKNYSLPITAQFPGSITGCHYIALSTEAWADHLLENTVFSGIIAAGLNIQLFLDITADPDTGTSVSRLYQTRLNSGVNLACRWLMVSDRTIVFRDGLASMGF